jgi:hypothetical protein
MPKRAAPKWSGTHEVPRVSVKYGRDITRHVDNEEATVTRSPIKLQCNHPVQDDIKQTVKSDPLGRNVATGSTSDCVECGKNQPTLRSFAFNLAANFIYRKTL